MHTTHNNFHHYNRYPLKHTANTKLMGLIFLCGYCHAHVIPKDATATSYSNRIFCASHAARITTPTISPYIKVYHTIYRIHIFAVESLDRKTTKYRPLMDSITTRGWNVAPIMVLVTSARATTHIPSMETKLELPTMKIKNTWFKQINIIPIQYAHSILVHKWRLENKQYITYFQDLPYLNVRTYNTIHLPPAPKVTPWYKMMPDKQPMQVTGYR